MKFLHVLSQLEYNFWMTGIQMLDYLSSLQCKLLIVYDDFIC